MPKKYEYKKNKRGDTMIRITVSAEQLTALDVIAKRHGLSSDDLLSRWIKRFIADQAMP